MANGELPEGWDIAPIGSLCIRTETVNPAHEPKANFEYIDVSAISNESWSIIGSTLYQGSQAPSRARKRVREGDVIFATVRPTLKRVALIPANRDGQVASTAFCILRRIPEKLDSQFLYYSLLTEDFTARMDNLQRGASYPAVSDGNILEQEILLPPPPEQQAIAGVLSKLQGAVEAQDKIIATLKELKAATLAKLFREGLRGETGTTETPYGEIPAHWSVSLLHLCAEVQTGVAKGRKLNGGHLIERPYLRVANVQDGYLDLREIKTIQLRASEADRFTLRDGDVLLTEGGDFDKLGRGFIWHEQVKDCVHQNHIFAVRTHHAHILPEFLTYLVQSPYGKAYFLNVAHKTTNLACINSTKLKEFPVLLPPVDEQRDIASSIANIDSSYDGAIRKRETLNRLFACMLHLLMTGEVRVKPLMKEAAS